MINRKIGLLLIVVIAFIGCGKNTVPISGTSSTSTSTSPKTQPLPAQFPLALRVTKRCRFLLTIP